MLIKPGSSGGAMWLYSDMMQRFDAQKAPAGQCEVSAALTALCPIGWQFKEHNGQWGLWPDDLLKYHTHALVYLQYTNKMAEVDIDSYK